MWTKKRKVMQSVFDINTGNNEVAIGDENGYKRSRFVGRLNLASHG